MNLKSAIIVCVGMGAALIWTGCEPSRRGRTNSGRTDTGVGMKTMKEVPKDKLWRIQIEDFKCLTQNIKWKGKDTQTAQQIAQGLTAKFENYILNSGAFIVLANRSSGDTDMAINEINETSSDYYDQDTSAESGKMQGAQYLMRGQVTAFNVIEGGVIGGGNRNFSLGIGGVTYEVRLNCRVMEIATRRLVFSCEGIGEIDDTVLIAGGGDQNWFVGGAFAQNTPIAEAVDAAVEELVAELVDRAYR